MAGDLKLGRTVHSLSYALSLYEGCEIELISPDSLKMPRDLVGEIHTKSKLARKGLSVHPSSGKVDAGFHNYLVLEIKNQGILPLALFEGDALAELQFSKLDRPTELPYRERKSILLKLKVLRFFLTPIFPARVCSLVGKR